MLLNLSKRNYDEEQKLGRSLSLFAYLFEWLLYRMYSAIWRFDIKAVNRTLFLGHKLFGLFLKSSYRKTVVIPTALTVFFSFQCDFALSIWCGISNYDNLIDFLLLVDCLKQHLNCFVSHPPEAVTLLKFFFKYLEYFQKQ